MYMRLIVWRFLRLARKQGTSFGYYYLLFCAFVRSFVFVSDVETNKEHALAQQQKIDV